MNKTTSTVQTTGITEIISENSIVVSLSVHDRAGSLIARIQNEYGRGWDNGWDLVQVLTSRQVQAIRNNSDLFGVVAEWNIHHSYGAMLANLRDHRTELAASANAEFADVALAAYDAVVSAIEAQ